MQPTSDTPRAVGRYLVAGPIAVGGMASVHFGLLNGPVGFRRTVAIKRMHDALAADPQARTMLLDEARLVARIQHANVVQTIDVVEEGGELFLVLEYVHGESLDRLLTAAGRCPPRIAAAVVAGALRGLHAAHEAKGEDGQPLEVVHRDFSPHNLLVGADGVARVLDFGVARARGRLQGTREGQLKGKLGYLAPEQVHGDASRRADVFAAGIVLWEGLAGRRLFDGSSEGEILANVLSCRVPPLASLEVDAAPLQAVLDRALEREPDARFATAAEMADALEACGAASATETARWVEGLAADTLAARTRAREALERSAADTARAPAPEVEPAPTAGEPPVAVATPAGEQATPAARGGVTPSGLDATSPLSALLQQPLPRAPLLIAAALFVIAVIVVFNMLRPAIPGAGRGPLGTTPGPAVHSAGQPPVVEQPKADEAGGVGGEPGKRGAAPSAGEAGGVSGRAPAPSRADSVDPKHVTPKHPKATHEEKAPKAETCNPPFVIDANGVKRFKVECLK